MTRNAFVTGLLVALAASASLAQKPAATSSRTEGTTPVLRNACLITKDVARLVDFYSRVLQISAKLSGNDYAEFHTGATVLAVFSADAQEKYIPGSAQAASNKSAILEFEVANVDQEYSRLKGVVKDGSNLRLRSHGALALSIFEIRMGIWLTSTRGARRTDTGRDQEGWYMIPDHSFGRDAD
jgi:hypothetical protein